jgi:protocatechuate 3,4-dioxygenase beta subunit
MDHDDRPIGQVLSRREALKLLSAIGVGLLAGCAPGQTNPAQPTASSATGPAPTAPAAGTVAAPACIVRPEQTEGPYFVDEQLNRSDIRSDPATGAVKDGTPLALILRVAQISGSACVPLAGALVDIWHCDADGYTTTFDIALQMA